MNSNIKLAQLSNLVGAFTGGSLPSVGALDWIEELLNPEAITKNLIFLTALAQNVNQRYNPNAYYHVLEMDKSRGYEAIDPNTGKPIIDPMTGKPMGTQDDPYVFQHSQGHLEKLDYNKLQRELNSIPSDPHGATSKHQFSELKPEQDMPMFVKKNINTSEFSPEYKAMFDKLYPGVSRPAPTAETKSFVKVAQTTRAESSINQTRAQKAEEIKRLMPNWNFENVRAALNAIDKKYGPNPTEKQKQEMKLLIQKTLKNFEDSMKPLHEYLVKNGYSKKFS